MALKLLKTHENNHRIAKVYYNPESKDYRVKHYVEGRYLIGMDSHWLEEQDAHKDAEHRVSLQEFLVQSYVNGTKQRVAHVHKDLNSGKFTVKKLDKNKDAGSEEFSDSTSAHTHAKRYINEGAMEDALKMIANIHVDSKKLEQEREKDPKYKEFKERMLKNRKEGDELMRRIRLRRRGKQPYQEEAGAAPVNSAGNGGVAGIGVGPQGEPGVDNTKKRKRSPVLMAVIRRVKPK